MKDKIPANQQDPKGKKPPRKKPTPKNTKAKSLEVHITHLEMNTNKLNHYNVPTRPVMALMRAENIQPDFYQFLYEKVGKPHHWFDRRDMEADELCEIINDENTQVDVLYADGCPAGFFELSLENAPEEIEILYFGLMPEYQGMGIGKWFLSAAIQSAWSHKPDKVTVQTNTLDHPASLGLYQRMGFSPTAISDDTISPWE